MDHIERVLGLRKELSGIKTEVFITISSYPAWLHMDAGNSAGDITARSAKVDQLLAYLAIHSAGYRSAPTVKLEPLTWQVDKSFVNSTGKAL